MTTTDTELVTALGKITRLNGTMAGPGGQYISDVTAKAAERLAALVEERDRLLEAIQPFADAAENIDADEPDRREMWEHPASMTLVVSDFRRALDARAQFKQDKGK